MVIQAVEKINSRLRVLLNSKVIQKDRFFKFGIIFTAIY